MSGSARKSAPRSAGSRSRPHSGSAPTSSAAAAPFSGAAQAVQRVEVRGIQLERNALGVERRGGAAQRPLADQREVEPVGATAADPPEPQREPPLELDPAAVGAQQAQAHAL